MSDQFSVSKNQYDNRKTHVSLTNTRANSASKHRKTCKRTDSRPT